MNDGTLVVIGSVRAGQYCMARSTIRKRGHKVRIQRFEPEELDVLSIMGSLHLLEQSGGLALERGIHVLSSKYGVHPDVIKQIFASYLNWQQGLCLEPAPWVARYYEQVLRIKPASILGTIGRKHCWGGNLSSDTQTDPFALFGWEFPNMVARYYVYGDGRVKFA
jgi:hypothetical protein